jgi:hypothetical protein
VGGDELDRGVIAGSCGVLDRLVDRFCLAIPDGCAPVTQLIVSSERRGGFVLVRSPSNPTHYWGNLLCFGRPPVAGDRARWEQFFDAEFTVEPEARHRTFAWDRVDGAVGLLDEEFRGRGYELEQTGGLLASPDTLRPHRRAQVRRSDGTRFGSRG